MFGVGLGVSGMPITRYDRNFSRSVVSVNCVGHGKSSTHLSQNLRLELLQHDRKENRGEYSEYYGEE